MTTGSLVLLGLFMLWASAVAFILYSLKDSKKDFLQKFDLYVARDFLDSIHQSSLLKLEEGLDPHTYSNPLYVLVIRSGYLLSVVLLVRLVLTPDPVTLGLAVLLLGYCAFYLYRLNRLKTACVNVNWRNLYELDPDYGVLEITLTAEGPGKEWIGSSLAELNLRKKELLVLAIIRQGKFTVFPKGPEILTVGDQVLVFGKYPPFGFGSPSSSASESLSSIQPDPTED